MSFAADYSTAYNILRTGEVKKDWIEILADRTAGWHLAAYREAEENLKAKRINKMGRIAAAIYAFKLAKEMRRQRILMTVLFPQKKINEQVVNNRPVNLFPITVNRTTVQMQAPKTDA